MAKSYSTVVGQKAAQTNYYAEDQAARIGLPFTHMVTINYSGTVIDPHMVGEAFSRLRCFHFNKWATRPRQGSGEAFQPTYAYAFENTRDGVPYMTMEPGDPHNVHVHWAVHIPADRLHDFENRLWEWVTATTGGIIGGGETIDVTASDNGSMGGYLIKGASPAVVAMYGRGRAAEAQGIIYGRRADTSRNIGPTKRRALDRELGIQRQMPRDRARPPVGLHL